MKKIVYSDELLAENVANEVVNLIKETLSKKQRFSLVLSGGKTPEKFYLEMSTKHKNALDWDKVDFFFGDERFVSDENQDSNYYLANKTLFEPLNIPSENIFKFNKDLPIQESADAYTEYVKDLQFDLTLLGIGDDCHTASLFPNQTCITSLEKKIYIIDYKKVNYLRLTFSPKLITDSKNIFVVATGKNKIKALDLIFNSNLSILECPAKILFNSNVTWYLDKSANNE